MEDFKNTYSMTSSIFIHLKYKLDRLQTQLFVVSFTDSCLPKFDNEIILKSAKIKKQISIKTFFF